MSSSSRSRINRDEREMIESLRKSGASPEQLRRQLELIPRSIDMLTKEMLQEENRSNRSEYVEQISDLRDLEYALELYFEYEGVDLESLDDPVESGNSKSKKAELPSRRGRDTDPGDTSEPSEEEDTDASVSSSSRRPAPRREQREAPRPSRVVNPDFNEDPRTSYDMIEEEEEREMRRLRGNGLVLPSYDKRIEMAIRLAHHYASRA